MSRFLQRAIVWIVVVVAWAGSAFGMELNWDSVVWPDESLANSYTVGGVGVDVAFSGSTDKLYAPFPTTDTSAYPGIGGLWPAAKNLATTDAVMLSIDFSQPVTDLTFSIYDVDFYITGTERVSYCAFDDGSTVYADVTLGSKITQETPVCFVGEHGNGAQPGDENNTLSFCFPYAVDSVELTFDVVGGGNFGLIVGDLTFVPEPATMSLLGVGLLSTLRRRK